MLVDASSMTPEPLEMTPARVPPVLVAPPAWPVEAGGEGADAAGLA